MNNPDYVMKIMESWMKLDELEGTKIRRYLIDSSGMKEKNQFTYRKPFGIHFRYINQVGYHSNWIRSTIYLERTWSTKFWTDHNSCWYLSVSEFNTALESGHF